MEFEVQDSTGQTIGTLKPKDDGGEGCAGAIGVAVIALLAWYLWGAVGRYAEYEAPFNWVAGLYYFTIFWPLEAIWSVNATGYPNLNVLIRIGIYLACFVALLFVVAVLREIFKKRAWLVLLAYLAPASLTGLWVGSSAVVGFFLYKAPPETTQTPFGVGASPEGQDVDVFARATHLPGDQADHNAPSWPRKAVGPVPDSIDGAWSSRRNVTTSSAQIEAPTPNPPPLVGPLDGIWVNAETTEAKTEGERVYLLVRLKGLSYLLVLLRDGNKLRGRFVELNLSKERGLFAGVVVNNQRIDGVWARAEGREGGRWDFRR